MADTTQLPSAPVSDTQTPTPATPPDPQSPVMPTDDTGTPLQPTGRRQKELTPAPSIPTVETSTGIGENAVETTVEQASTGPVEVEPAKELEPEIEKMVEKIKKNEVKAPQETVISAEQTPDTLPKTVAQPVVVLPLTEKGMKKGRSKNTQFSVRWLYEWCVRQIRKLKDFLVVYRED